MGDISDVSEEHCAYTFDPEDGGQIAYSYIVQHADMLSPSSGWKTKAVMYIRNAGDIAHNRSEQTTQDQNEHK